jgi:GT2 family glycosyltransferase
LEIEVIRISKELQPDMNRSEARNFVCSQSSADAYAFLNSDARPSDCWLEEMKRSLEEGADIVYGPEIMEGSDGKAPKYFTPRRKLVFHNQNINAPSVNLVYRADVFWNICGFDPDFNVAEDLDLNYRAVDSGYKIAFNEYACVFHSHRSSFLGFLKQSFWYGYGWSEFENKHKISLSKPKLRELSGMMLFRCVFSGFGYIYGKSKQNLGL